ncbi:MAG: ribose 5-phosphate isomerase B [Acidimicrobiales bacterium]
MRLALGSDHAGYLMKAQISGELGQLGHEVVDLGTHSAEPVDYPDYGAEVGRAVVSGEVDFGVCICGTGIGIGIAANKIRGVRAAVVHDVSSARLAREHNDANVVCLGARLIGPSAAVDSVIAFLEAEFQGGRHIPRIAKISELEAEPQ